MNEERRRLLLQIGSAAAFLALVAVAVLIVVNANQTSGGDEQLEGVREVRRQLRGIPQSGTVLGEESAKVTLIEFGDLQCPVCKGFAEEILPQVIEAKVRDGKAKIDFRNYAIIGGESVEAGAAAIAAGKQGRGWSFIELFYRNQGIENSGYVTDDFLTVIAKAAGVPDLDRWNHDRKDPSTLALVSRGGEEARRLGFTGTPSFAVTGPGGGFETLGTPSSAGEIEDAIDAAG
jgi:protein-disulfide isomerase